MSRYRALLLYLVLKIGIMLLIREALKYNLKKQESQRIHGI